MAAPYAEGEAVSAEMVMDVEDDSVSTLDVLIQAAYMLPVVGNVMAIGDVARDIGDLGGTDPQGIPNSQSTWLWAVLVIDALGLVPAFGSAPRPIRLGTREGLLAFARGDGVDTAAEILFNLAGGQALAFLEKLEPWFNGQQPTLLREISRTVETLEDYITNPVDTATQLGKIQANPECWSVLEQSKRIVFVAFDRLLDAFGDERDTLIRMLRDLDGMASEMVTAGITHLIPLLRQLARAVSALVAKRGGITKSGTVITGQVNRTELGAENRQSTRHEADASPTPAGCACAFAAPTSVSANPIDYVMGDENLWHTDFRVPGLIDVEWTRYYRSSIDELD
ncbi:DUF6531 domain-containing protein, partial [Halomonas sp. V046]|uniref:DUF6531 domain-containing protein n=1 Tax=Halomonas sp. V046 TaxID=3459611 RepID=UPI0040440FE8